MYVCMRVRGCAVRVHVHGCATAQHSIYIIIIRISIYIYPPCMGACAVCIRVCAVYVYAYSQQRVLMRMLCYIYNNIIYYYIVHYTTHSMAWVSSVHGMSMYIYI